MASVTSPATRRSTDLHERLGSTAFVFRGYNVTNLGRSRELLAHPAYGPVVEHHLQQASQVASEMLSCKIDLVARVERGEETDLETYGDAVALILAVEQAQMQLLAEFFGVDYKRARLAFGYSLGEIAALVPATSRWASCSRVVRRSMSTPFTNFVCESTRRARA